MINWHFFYGDKPAAQFERGTQVGGHYPCGACGAHISRFDDFAHLSNLSWRSLQELQDLVTKGLYFNDILLQPKHYLHSKGSLEPRMNCLYTCSILHLWLNFM